MEDHRGRGLGNHPWVVAVGIVASAIGIINFVTGKQQLSDFLPTGRVASRTELQQPEATPMQSDAVSPQVKPVSLEKSESEEASRSATRSLVVALDSRRAKDIWTTSVFSYAPGTRGPGGGLDDDKLRVGGWGDLYHSLIWFDLQGLPSNVSAAKLQLYTIPHEGGAGSTPLLVDRITEHWDWRTEGSGIDHDRLWWQDRPSTQDTGSGTLPPPEMNDWYSIDITELYNSWQRGDYPNYGLQLRPVRNDNNWATFVSSDEESQKDRRPRLLLEVEADK